MPWGRSGSGETGPRSRPRTIDVGECASRSASSPARVRRPLALRVRAAAAASATSGPQLIEVLDLAPHEVETGDRVELIGASFPQGKKARVTFRGQLHRPGEKPASAEIAAEGTASTATQLELDFTEGLEGLFCGAGENTAHTTFEGDVEVAFPAATAGAPPVLASLHAITLDVRPPTPRRALIDQRIKEGENALAFFGIHVSKSPLPAGGLLVDTVDKESRAEKATIAAGDTLVAFDHVRISSPADVIPYGGQALAATTTLRHGAARPRRPSRELHVEGFRASPPADLYGAGLLLLIAVGVLLFFMAPTAGILTWVERRIAGRIQSRVGAEPRRTLTGFFFVWVADG